MPSPTYIWNHRAHQQWAGETLSFWRLAFFPRFDDQKVRAAIDQVLAEQGVSSYAVYETLGLFDLFLRAWLPSQSHEEVERALEGALEGQSLQLIESFTVHRTLRHHVWDDGKGGLREPDPGVLDQRLDNELIENVNQGKLSRKTRERLEGQNLITGFPSGSGIKFFTVITSPVFSSTFGVRHKLEQDLLKVIAASGVTEPSLYEGSGFGNYIVMGRARLEDFFAIPRLANAINDLGIYETFTARPYTHVCADQGFVCHELIPPDPSRAIEVERLLAQPESNTIEVKASVRLNWRQWLSDPAQEVITGHDDVVNEGMIKAVTGMLNADGGYVVLGALERARINSEALERDPRLQNFDVIGDYLVVGLDDEEKYRSGGWDGLRLQILQLIDSRIEPSPAGLIDLMPTTIGDRTLCVISIQPSTSTWFYRRLANDDVLKFYVREHGRTVAYAGPDADAYKRARPRG